jgi:hypothetical protein
MNLPQNSYRYINKYIEIFSCVFSHDFYDSRICNEVTFLPTERTRFLIKNYSLVFKLKAGGFVLAANFDKDYSNPIYKDPFDLDFVFKFSNSYFHSFTDISIDPEIRYFFDDDFRSSVSIDPDSGVNDPELDKPGISGIIRIKHVAEHPLLPFKAGDANGFNSRKKEFIFKSRQIKPVYICYVSENNLDQFQGLLIESEGEFKDQIDFGPPVLTKTNSGLTAFKFVAKGEIPMKSSWKGFFKLKRYNQLGMYVKTLPNPNPKNIKFDPTQNAYLSENYVKL